MSDLRNPPLGSSWKRYDSEISTVTALPEDPTAWNAKIEFTSSIFGPQWTFLGSWREEMTEAHDVTDIVTELAFLRTVNVEHPNMVPEDARLAKIAELEKALAEVGR